MAMQASWSKVEEIVEKAKNLAKKAQEKAQAVGAQAAHVAGQTVNALEVNAVAFGFGFMRGYWGDVRFLGIPVDVLSGTLLNLAGIGLIMSGNPTAELVAPHINSLGNGALAAGSTAFGASIGADLRAKKGASNAAAGGGWNVVAGGPPAPAPGQMLPALPPVRPASPLTQDELIAAAQYRAA